MARRAPEQGSGPAARTPGPAAKAAGSDDLAVMYPDTTLTLAGRSVVVREYRFDESCDVLAAAVPLIADIADLAEGESLTWGRVKRRLYAQRRLVLPLAALAGDVECAWLEALPAALGEQYLQAWWAVNGHFFVAEAAVLMVERQEQRKTFAGRTSSSSSPLPASAHPNASAGTPSVN